jgi:hypothetical protein
MALECVAGIGQGSGSLSVAFISQMCLPKGRSERISQQTSLVKLSTIFHVHSSQTS